MAQDPSWDGSQSLNQSYKSSEGSGILGPLQDGSLMELLAKGLSFCWLLAGSFSSSPCQTLRRPAYTLLHRDSWWPQSRWCKRRKEEATVSFVIESWSHTLSLLPYSIHKRSSPKPGELSSISWREEYQRICARILNLLQCWMGRIVQDFCPGVEHMFQWGKQTISH